MRLNGIDPPIGTLLPGVEPLVVIAVDNQGVELRAATNADFMQANMRKPAEVHSVYEHSLIPRRSTPFGMARVMG